MNLKNIVCIVVVFYLTYNSALELSIVHLNDFHARFEETSINSGVCKSDNCIGGFSRVYTTVKQLLNERPNGIFLNAGDNFQGTLWYNLFKWNVTQYFLNMLPTDVMTLGNHEFDDNIQGLVPFLKTIKTPVVVSNIDDSKEPDIQGLYKKSVVIERGGKKIGIVGVILSTTNQIASTHNLIFLDESESVNDEAQRLLDEEGVFTVIVLSHCGYDNDKEIARKAISGISVIVGSHSHTLLYTGMPLSDAANGPYPTVVQSISNEPVLVVQAYANTKYLGNLSVEYNDMGKLINWEGNPIYLDHSIPQDARINELLEPYKIQVRKAGQMKLGVTNVLLSQTNCKTTECSIGNFLTDAMVAHYAKFAQEGTWTRASIAVLNAGGIRASINIGDITYNDFMTSQPFENTIDYGEIQGKFIKAFMEIAAMPFSCKKCADINLLQVSGMKVVLDVSQPEGSRVKLLKIRCHRCEVPTFEDVDLEKYYPIAVPSFLIRGGDGFKPIAENLVNYTIGPLDSSVAAEYIMQQSPIITGLDERITIIGKENVTYSG